MAFDLDKEPKDGGLDEAENGEVLVCEDKERVEPSFELSVGVVLVCEDEEGDEPNIGDNVVGALVCEIEEGVDSAFEPNAGRVLVCEIEEGVEPVFEPNGWFWACEDDPVLFKTGVEEFDCDCSLEREVLWYGSR